MAADNVTAAFVTFRFGDFELDTAAYELRRKGRRIRLARQPMDLLILMVARPHALVSRDEIRRQLWTEDVFVDVDAGIRTAVLKIRQVLGDRRKLPRFVETVPGKGYRFIAPVAVVASNLASTRKVSAAMESRTETLRHNLPTEITSFVGRDKELRQLRQLLSTSRLLSLTGAGGVGKTRLALRLMWDLVRTVSGGVWLIDVAPLSTPEQIAQAVAAVLGVRESPERSVREAVIDYVRDRELLFLFDTCEHQITGCAELAETLLRRAPGLRIVTTTREVLRLPGETVFRVPSLSIPDAKTVYEPEALADFEATRLFVDRAAAAAPDFAPNLDDARSIGNVCRQLDGIPLAIELVAAHL